MNWDPSSVALLLSQGGDLEAEDSRGRTPLLWALERHDAAIASQLVLKGANFRVKSHAGDAALKLACRLISIPLV